MSREKQSALEDLAMMWDDRGMKKDMEKNREEEKSK